MGLVRSLDIEINVSLVAENCSFPGKAAYFPFPIKNCCVKVSHYCEQLKHRLLMFSVFFSERLVRSIL